MILSLDPPKFDLESYIANYTGMYMEFESLPIQKKETDKTIESGRTRFDRLFQIGTCSTVLSTEALKAAVIEAKSGKDIGRYERAVRALAEVAPSESEAMMDTPWALHMQKVIKAETDRLEHELKGYKNNLIKESIRVRVWDMGCNRAGDRTV